MERLARRVIDSKNIRCHVEFEYHSLHNIDIHTLRRYPSTHVRSKRNPFSRVKMFNACREEEFTAGEEITFSFPLRIL